MVVMLHVRTTNTTTRRQFCSRVATCPGALPNCCWPQRAAFSLLMAARDAHSAGPREKVVRREERQEGEVHEENDGSRAQTTPLLGVRPAPLSEVAGPQAAVTVGYVAAGPPSLVVALVVVHDHVDQASVQFLLQQSLLARASEEEKAREEAEVKMLEDDVADKESLLLEELCKVRDGVWPRWSKFSGIEKAAVHWHVALVKARKKKGSKKRKKRRRKKLPKTSSSLLRPLPHLWFFLVFGIWVLPDEF